MIDTLLQYRDAMSQFESCDSVFLKKCFHDTIYNAMGSTQLCIIFALWLCHPFQCVLAHAKFGFNFASSFVA